VACHQFDEITKTIRLALDNHWAVKGEKKPVKNASLPKEYTEACSAAALALRDALFPPNTADLGTYSGRGPHSSRFHTVRFGVLQGESIKYCNISIINTKLIAMFS
jgi:hypothetical protein